MVNWVYGAEAMHVASSMTVHAGSGYFDVSPVTKRGNCAGRETKVRKDPRPIVAHCDSHKCHGKEVGSVEISEAKRGDTNCPRCNNYLYWGRRGANNVAFQ